MGDQVRINGNLYSWSSIKLKVGGEVYTGITSVGYSDKRERVKGYGQGRHHAPYGRSAGKYTPDNVKVTMWRNSAQLLRAALARLAPDGISYGNVEFQLVIQYIEFGGDPITVDIDRCVFASNESGDEESPDPLKENLEFDPMVIRRNGLTLFDSTQGAPV
ncbi:MAG: hypothetical protein H0X39_00490 [Actinobacteria bacterium]|nr:hypothetical protein [Actinomycetota bacterium]